MKKSILFVTMAVSFFASSAFADLAVGGYFGVNQAQTDYSGTGSAGGKQGSEIGIFVLTPIVPTLSLRVGLAQKIKMTHHEETVFTISAAGDITETFTDLGVGVQWDLPVTDLYLMGGAKVSSSKSITCDVSTPNVVFSNCEKTKTDYPLFAGVGYDFLSLAVAKISFEAEYEKVSAANNMDSKNHALTGRLIVKVGF